MRASLRDHEYKRHGTLSLLAGIDLRLTGKVHALVRERRTAAASSSNSLKLLDAAYPASTAIKLILDNHSAHISKGNPSLARHPAARPLRLYLHAQAPAPGSNLIEGFFSKFARSVTAPYPSDIKARTQATHHGRHRRRQSPSRHPHLVLQACRGRLI